MKAFTYTNPATLYVKNDAGTNARTPAVLPPPPVGEGQGFPAEKATAFFAGPRGGVCLHTSVLYSQSTIECALAHRLPPKRQSVGWVSAQRVTQQRHNPFTYTLVATPYVKNDAGTNARTPTVLPPPPVGEGQGFPAEKATAFFAEPRGGVRLHSSLNYSQSTIGCASAHHSSRPVTQQPTVQKPLTPPQPSPTGGGSAFAGARP